LLLIAFVEKKKEICAKICGLLSKSIIYGNKNNIFEKKKMNFKEEEKTDWNGAVKIRLDLNNRF